MSNIRYYNQSAPFWDFIANFENRIPHHPNMEEASRPWAWGWNAGPAHNTGPSDQQGPPPAPQPTDRDAEDAPTPSTVDPEKHPDGPPTDHPQHQSPPLPHHPHRAHPFHRGCGPRGRGNWTRGRGGPRGFNPDCRPPFSNGSGPSGLGWLPAFIQSQMFGGPSSSAQNGPPGSETFTPAVDVFDTEAAFIIHVSLPGAQRDDIAVTYDAEKSEVVVAGVVHRPGDEALLSALAMGERSVGAFERRVRLGSPANPAQVDVDGVTARLDDGVLRIEVPKADAEFVEVRRVDVE